MKAELTSILMATDLTARSDRPFDRALTLKRESGATLNILHVTDAEKTGKSGDYADYKGSAIKSIEAHLQGEPAKIFVETGSLPRVIAKIADDTGSDLIVTGAARWNGIGDFFLGTAVDYVVRHASQPVLVVKQRPLNPYREILVATDLSDSSRTALITAAGMFPQANLHLVHAYHVPYEQWLNSDGVHEEMRAYSQKELEDFLAQSEIPEALRKRVHPTLAYGESSSAVLETAKNLQPDLVVLGTQGRGPVAHAVMGSVATDLLGTLPMDTLMVRGK